MGNTRDCFKKIGDAKGMFHAIMGKIKDRNSNDLTEAEEIKKRWQEYTEGLYIKGLNNADNHNDVITHLEPGILECEVKLALGRITMNKASGGEKILPVVSDGKVSAYNEGDPGSIPGSGRSPGEGNGNPLQYSCLENPMDIEAW